MLKQPSTERPRCTPTSTLSAPSFIARRTISCREARKCPPQGHRRRGRDPLRRPGDHGHPRPIVGSLPSLASGSRHLFPELPQQPGFHKRRARLAETIEWLIGVFAAESPGYPRRRCCSSTRLRWSAPARSRRRAVLPSPMQPTTAGAPVSFSILLGLSTARPLRARRHTASASPSLLPSATSERWGSSCSNGQAEAVVRSSSATRDMRARASPRRSEPSTQRSSGRARKDEPDSALQLAPIRQRIESIFWTCKDILTLERHGARTLHEPARPHLPAPLGAGRVHRAQPQARASEPRPGRLRRLRAWNQPSSAGRSGTGRAGAGDALPEYQGDRSRRRGHESSQSAPSPRRSERSPRS